ncbi:MAG TPA: lipopolysaccharide transport periplasmic protein LptA [Nitrospiraceae bacterium]|nr:lipopolysaccharide transport periplasmic protein LptA [Nitrospiraceae bacterium]
MSKPSFTDKAFLSLTTETQRKCGLNVAKGFFIIIIIMLWSIPSFAGDIKEQPKAEKKPIIITSTTLTADNKTNTAIFEGSVVAKTEDITIYSDKMIVYSDNTRNKITKIEAYGNVRAHKKERAIFSEKATYYEEDEKIVFTGEPKAVEGENVITGTKITYFINDDRAIVEDSRAFLKRRGAR